ncbi:hypothetical protein HDV04_000372 [Boothiomyces sp. JEL0838]|nr:hypothetical protein HDV04_000372 [Boothiomyces sp. JEL0838]
MILKKYFIAQRRFKSSLQNPTNSSIIEAPFKDGVIQNTDSAINSFHITPSSRRPISLAEKERQLLVKSVAIVGTFMVCWVPYTSVIFYSVVTASFAALSNSTFNPFLLITLDMRIREYALEFLHLKNRIE